MLVPHRVAIALQADGWWVRDCIIWHKPNPMPSSVTDRTTTAHEYVFMLTKAERYFYDQDAIAEESVTMDERRPYTSQGAKDLDGREKWKSGEPRDGDDFTKRNARSVWSISTEGYPGSHFAVMPQELVRRCILAGSPKDGLVLDPFMGSGTVASVAIGCGRQYVGYELNPEYHRLIAERLGLFAQEFSG
jgi:DNA modification methylase